MTKVHNSLDLCKSPLKCLECVCVEKLYIDEIGMMSENIGASFNRYSNNPSTESGKALLRKITKKSQRNFSNILSSTENLVDSIRSTTVGEIHRCLIYAQHIRVLDLIEKLVLKAFFPNVSYSRMDGNMDAQKRGEIAKKFNSSARNRSGIAKSNRECIDRILHLSSENLSYNSDIRILLMTTRSCGLGLNLSAADVVIFVQHDWNPFVDLQVKNSIKCR